MPVTITAVNVSASGPFKMKLCMHRFEPEESVIKIVHAVANFGRYVIEFTFSRPYQARSL